jgi:hypothetical protein
MKRCIETWWNDTNKGKTDVLGEQKVTVLFNQMQPGFPHSIALSRFPGFAEFVLLLRVAMQIRTYVHLLLSSAETVLT